MPHILQSVLLFDSLNTDFDITYILRHNNGSWDKVPVHGSAEEGAGMLLNYKILPADKLQVKVRWVWHKGNCVTVCVCCVCAWVHVYR